MLTNGVRCEIEKFSVNITKETVVSGTFLIVYSTIDPILALFYLSFKLVFTKILEAIDSPGAKIGTWLKIAILVAQT